MTTLAQDAARAFVSVATDFAEKPMIATDIIYQGAAVGDNASGYARPLVSGDRFLGFAETRCDNAAGAAGAKNVRMIKKGLVQLTITGVAITDVGRPVFADDDDAFALVGLGSYIGKVQRYVEANTAVVEFDAERPEIDEMLSIPIQLATIPAGDVLTNLPLHGYGRIKALDAFVTVAATTGSKAATLNAEIGSTNLTGGTVALTSANCTPLGAKIAGAAITAANAFVPGDTLSIEGSSVTAFVEGAIVLIVKIGRPG